MSTLLSIISYLIGKEQGLQEEFKSNYEGIAYLHEGVDEIMEDATALLDAFCDAFEGVKQGDDGLMDISADAIDKIATHLACEAVRVAAMANVFRGGLKREKRVTLDDGTEAPSFIKETKLTIKIVDEEEE